MANPTLLAEFAPGKNWNDVIVPNGADLDGTGDYASMPDSAAMSPVGDQEGRFILTPDSWAPAANNDPYSKFAANPELGIIFRIRTDGKLQLTYSEDGITWETDVVSSTTTGFSASTTAAIAYTLDVNGGTGGIGLVTFFYWQGTFAPPLALSDWTQLGTAQDTTGSSAPTSVNDSTADPEFGSASSGSEVAGILHEAAFYAPLQADGGTLLANPRFHDPSVWTIGDTGTGLDFQGNVWTLQANAVIIGSWIDISSDVRPGYRVKRGRQTPFTRMRPSTLTCRLGDSTGNYDPENTGGAYTGDLKLGVPVRFRTKHNAVIYPEYYGFAQSWIVEAPGKKGDTFTTLKASDGLNILQRDVLESPWQSLVGSLNPRVWYRFDENAGTILYDSSGNGHDGEIFGTPTGFRAAGPIAADGSTALTFDGVDDYVELPQGAKILTDPYTICVWVKTSFDYAGRGFGGYIWAQAEVIGGDFTLTKGYHYGWINDGPGASEHKLQNAARSSTSLNAVSMGNYPADPDDLDDGVWRMVAIAVSSAGVFDRIINGVDVGTQDTENPMTFSSVTKFFLGTSRPDGSAWWVGEMDEFLIFDSRIVTPTLLAMYEAATVPWNGDTTDGRITRVLDAVGWPTLQRDLSVGVSSMQSLTTTNQTALAAIYDAVDTEDGEMFIAADGRLTFRNRNDRDVSAYAATFSNDGSDIPYQDPKPTRDPTLLRNLALVTDSDGIVWESKDTDSITAHARRNVTRTTDTAVASEPKDYADWLAAEFGTVRTSLKLTLKHGRTTSDAAWAAMLSRELGDLVKVEVTPIHGGSQVSHDMFVEELTITGLGVAGKEMIIGLSPAKNQRMFTLDDDVLGELDGANEGLLGW